MQVDAIDIRSIIPYGGATKIAKKLGITTQAVSQALKAAKATHPAVKEAFKLAEESDSLAIAQKLAFLKAAV